MLLHSVTCVFNITFGWHFLTRFVSVAYEWVGNLILVKVDEDINQQIKIVIKRLIFK